MVTSNESLSHLLVIATLKRAAILLEMGQTNEALEEFKSAYEASPSLAAEPYAKALFQKGQEKTKAGDIDGALVNFRSTLEIAPDGRLKNEISGKINDLENPKPVQPPACPSCRRETKPGWKNCPHCGTTLIKYPPLPSTQAQPRIIKSIRKLDFTKQPWLWIILVGFGGIILIGGIIFIINNFASQSQAVVFDASPTHTISLPKSTKTNQLPTIRTDPSETLVLTITNTSTVKETPVLLKTPTPSPWPTFQVEQGKNGRDYLNAAMDIFSEWSKQRDETILEGVISNASRCIQLEKDKIFLSFCYGLRSTALEYTSGFAEALADINKAIELYPDAVHYSSRATLYRRVGNFNAALEDVNKVMEIKPDDASSYHDRALLYSSMGDFEAAIADQRIVIKKNPSPSDGGNFYLLGKFFERNKEYAPAIKEYTKAIPLGTFNDAWIRRGDCNQKLGNYQDAIVDYSTILSNYPENTGLLLSRAKTYQLMGDQEKAIKDFSTIIEIEIEDDELGTHYHKGVAYSELGYQKEAKKEFEFIIQWNFDPDGLRAGDYFYFRSLAYRRLGKNAQADADLAEAHAKGNWDTEFERNST